MIATTPMTEVAVEELTRGYEEQARLYARMLELSLEQRETLRKGSGMDRFMDLFEEKDDILRLAGEIDDRMTDAKESVMSADPEECSGRERLGALLDCVAMLIEDIRFVETSNAVFLGADRAARATTHEAEAAASVGAPA